MSWLRGKKKGDENETAERAPDAAPMDEVIEPLLGEVIPSPSMKPTFNLVTPSNPNALSTTAALPPSDAPADAARPPQPSADAAAPLKKNAVPGPDRPCPVCSEMAPFDANFCEECGADLVAGTRLPTEPAAPPQPTEPCVSCAALPSAIHDGYCSECGTKQPALRDHLEVDLGWAASVTDRGKSHHHNEDACAVSTHGGAAIVVVCDGVSSTDRPEEASELAANLIRDLLESALHAGADVAAAITDALSAANAQVATLGHAAASDPPSCTVVAAVAEPGTDGEIRTTIGWLGDSRAYWWNDGVATQLTTDHSWAVDQAKRGTLDAEMIEADPRAHSITRWLGADTDDAPPELIEYTAAAGTLLLCSDGLWNYAPESSELAALLLERASTPVETARALVQFANDSGGHDNITVAIADFDSANRESAVTAHRAPLD